MALSLSSRAGLSWKRMLVVLIAIPAVIVALLAMHLLLSGSPTPDAHAATESGSLFGSAAAESPLVAVFQGDATGDGLRASPFGLRVPHTLLLFAL